MKFFQKMKERRAQKAEERLKQQQELERLAREKEIEKRRLPELYDKTLEILAEGKLPRITVENRATLPVRLAKSEVVLAVVHGCQYMETFIKKEYIGKSAGMSFRVAKGVSIRTGGSRGTPVETEELRDYGEGTFLMTQKGLYFKNGVKAIRAPMNKILSCEVVDEGTISFVRDRARSLPEYLLFGDVLWLPDYIQQVLSHLPDVPTSAAKEDNLVDPDFWILGEGIVEKDFS